MGLRLALVATVLFCCTIGLQAASKRMMVAAERPRLMVFGDSLALQGSQPNGWVQQLGTAYAGVADVLNYASNTTAAGTATLIQRLMRGEYTNNEYDRIALAILAMGTNEALEDSKETITARAEVFHKKVNSIVERLNMRGINSIVLVTPPPVGAFNNARQMASSVADVASARGLPYVDLLSSVAASPDWKANMLDGSYRLSAKGQELLYNKVMDAINSHYENVTVAALKDPVGFAQSRAAAAQQLTAPVAPTPASTTAVSPLADIEAPAPAPAADSGSSSQASQQQEQQVAQQPGPADSQPKIVEAPAAVKTPESSTPVAEPVPTSTPVATEPAEPAPKVNTPVAEPVPQGTFGSSTPVVAEPAEPAPKVNTPVAEPVPQGTFGSSTPVVAEPAEPAPKVNTPVAEPVPQGTFGSSTPVATEPAEPAPKVNTPVAEPVPQGTFGSSTPVVAEPAEPAPKANTPVAEPVPQGTFGSSTPVVAEPVPKSTFGSSTPVAAEPEPKASTPVTEPVSQGTFGSSGPVAEPVSNTVEGLPVIPPALGTAAPAADKTEPSKPVDSTEAETPAAPKTTFGDASPAEPAPSKGTFGNSEPADTDSSSSSPADPVVPTHSTFGSSPVADVVGGQEQQPAGTHTDTQKQSQSVRESDDDDDDDDDDDEGARSKADAWGRFEDATSEARDQQDGREDEAPTATPEEYEDRRYEPYPRDAQDLSWPGRDNEPLRAEAEPEWPRGEDEDRREATPEAVDNKEDVAADKPEPQQHHDVAPSTPTFGKPEPRQEATSSPTFGSQPPAADVRADLQRYRDSEHQEHEGYKRHEDREDDGEDDYKHHSHKYDDKEGHHDDKKDRDEDADEEHENHKHHGYKHHGHKDTDKEDDKYDDKEGHHDDKDKNEEEHEGYKHHDYKHHGHRDADKEGHHDDKKDKDEEHEGYKQPDHKDTDKEDDKEGHHDDKKDKDEEVHEGYKQPEDHEGKKDKEDKPEGKPEDDYKDGHKDTDKENDKENDKDSYQDDGKKDKDGDKGKTEDEEEEYKVPTRGRRQHRTRTRHHVRSRHFTRPIRRTYGRRRHGSAAEAQVMSASVDGDAEEPLDDSSVPAEEQEAEYEDEFYSEGTAEQADAAAEPATPAATTPAQPAQPAAAAATPGAAQPAAGASTVAAAPADAPADAEQQQDAAKEQDQAADSASEDATGAGSDDISEAVSGVEEDANKPLIVTIGDYVMRQGSFGTGIVASKTDAPGWISRLAAAYGDGAQVVNKGHATATSPMGVQMVDELLSEYTDAADRIKLVVLSFGGNDAITRAVGAADAKVPISTYKANLKAMISKLQDQGIKNILVVTPPPAARRMDRRFKTIKEYAKAASDVAENMHLETVDLFGAVAAMPNWQASAMKADGLRLSERGQQLLFKRVMKVLGGQLRTVSPSALSRST